MLDKYLTTAEVAEALRISPRTVRWWRQTGYGPPAITLGGPKQGRVIYRESDLAAWLERRHAEQAPQDPAS